MGRVHCGLLLSRPRRFGGVARQFKQPLPTAIKEVSVGTIQLGGSTKIGAFLSSYPCPLRSPRYGGTGMLSPPQTGWN